MDEELNVDPKYKEAYNTGYLLAKEKPDVFQQMPESIDKNNPYNHGLLAGKRQYEAEQAKAYFKSFDRGDSKDRGKNKGDKGIKK